MTPEELDFSEDDVVGDKNAHRLGEAQCSPEDEKEGHRTVR